MSPVAIDKAKALHPNNMFILGINHEIDKFGKGFDVIFTNAHLQHVANTNKNYLFQQIVKNLFRGGLLITAAEKHDVDSRTTMLKDKWIEFVRGYGFKLEKYIGDPQNGFLFRKL